MKRAFARFNRGMGLLTMHGTKGFSRLVRRVAVGALAIAFAVNPLAAQERPYFRYNQGPGSGGSTTPSPNNPLTATLSMPSGSVTLGQAINLAPVAQNIPSPITWSLAGVLPAGSVTFNPSTGVVSGIPTAAGTSPLTLTASNGSTQASASFSIVVSPIVPNPPVVASYPSTFTAVAGETLSIPGPSVSNGRAPFTYGIVPVNPPFSFNPLTGEITWAPSAATTINGITVSVTDADQASDVSNAFSIVVNPALTAGSYAGTKELFIGESASFPLVGALGGRGTLSFSPAGLPPGMGLGSGGVVTGTPTVPGSYSGTVTVSDADGRQDTAAFDAVIYPQLTVSLPTSPPPVATRNVAIAPIELVTTGGKSPYVYSTGGNVPPGLEFSNGILSGIPTVTGNYDFELFATESLSGRRIGSGLLNLVVAPAPMALSSSNGFPATIAVGSTAGSIKVTASGGVAPYSYAVVDGSLPPGLTLNSTTGDVTGATTYAGVNVSHTFTIRASDSQASPFTANLGPYTVSVTDPSPLSIAYGASIFDGLPNVPVNVPLPTVTGGSGGLTYVSSSPTDLVVTNGTGAATFTKTTPGTYGPYAITATDTIGRTSTASVSFQITAPPVVTEQNFATATQTQTNYSSAAVATGGTAPYSWVLMNNGTVVDNLAPVGDTGLTWNSGTGVISGVVSASATTQSTLTLQATDSMGRVSATTGNLTLQVVPRPSGLAYPASSTATVGTPLTINPSSPAVGGTGPYSYAFNLAPTFAGIAINAATGEITVPANAPIANYTFKVVATDANGATTAIPATTNAIVVQPVQDPRTLIDLASYGGTGSVTYWTLRHPVGPNALESYSEPSASQTLEIARDTTSYPYAVAGSQYAKSDVGTTTIVGTFRFSQNVVAKNADQIVTVRSATGASACPSMTSSATYEGSMDGTNWTLLGSISDIRANAPLLDPNGYGGATYALNFPLTQMTIRYARTTVSSYCPNITSVVYLRSGAVK